MNTKKCDNLAGSTGQFKSNPGSEAGHREVDGESRRSFLAKIIVAGAATSVSGFPYIRALAAENPPIKAAANPTIKFGNEVGSGYCEYPCIYPHPGWVEQDIEEVWKGICLASRIARLAANVADDAIRSLGFSSQRGSFILLDEQERPLAPAVLWNDSRAKDMERLIPKLSQKQMSEHFLQLWRELEDEIKSRAHKTSSPFHEE